MAGAPRFPVAWPRQMRFSIYFQMENQLSQVSTPTPEYQLRLQELHDLGRIELRLVDVTDDAAVKAAIAGDGNPASWVWIETPTNPMMEICDIEATATVARHYGAYLAVDNTFMTPLAPAPT